MERILRKNVEAEIREKAEKKMVPYPLNNVEKDDFYSFAETGVRPLGKASLDSLFRNRSYEEAAELLKKAFDDASEQYGVPVSELQFVKGWGQGSIIQGFRLETDEELEDRIQQETDSKVETLRRNKESRRNAEYQKKKQIEKLEKELAALKK